MASITIRGLDEELKQRLRLRAARNGRSMEDEARTILRDMAADRPLSGIRNDPRRILPDPRHAPRAADHRRWHRGV
jgi:phosphopantothenoylcysteine decarboxylase/phosphopantothenate--cysteine ligase